MKGTRLTPALVSDACGRGSVRYTDHAEKSPPPTPDTCFHFVASRPVTVVSISAAHLLFSISQHAGCLTNGMFFCILTTKREMSRIHYG